MSSFLCSDCHFPFLGKDYANLFFIISVIHHIFFVIQPRRRACVSASMSEQGEYYAQRPPTPLLDTINYPIHMKNLSMKVDSQSYKIYS